MRIAKVISQSKAANIFLLGMAFLLIGLGLITMLVGVFASLHSLVTWDPGLHGIKLGIGLGGLAYGALLLFLGLVGIKTLNISDTNV